MNERSRRKASRSQARDAARYASQLAGFGAFTLRRKVWPDQPGGLMVDEDVYRSAEPDEVGELRRLLAARPLGAYCICIGSASISLDGGAAPLVLSVHHGASVRWHGAESGNFELEHGRDLRQGRHANESHTPPSRQKRMLSQSARTASVGTVGSYPTSVEKTAGSVAGSDCGAHCCAKPFA